MVCKNCGADLKPGIKYCLECGNYIDEDEYSSTSSSGGVMNGAKPYQLKSVRKQKKKKIKPVDLLIYVGLSIIIVVSIIVIIYTLFFSQQEEVITDTPVVSGEVTINVDDYELTLPRYLNYDIQGSTIFVSDNQNFTLSYKNTYDNYDSYAKDLSILTDDLTENNYEVLSVGKREANGCEFIICEIRVNGRIKYLYLTKLGKYTTMGVIDPFEGGVWDEALNVVADMNNSAVVDDVHANTYNNTSNTDDGTNELNEQNPVPPDGNQPAPPEGNPPVPPEGNPPGPPVS